MDLAMPERALDEPAPANHTALEAPAQTPAPARQAAETRRLYAADWDAFVTWGRARHYAVLPAHPETVAAYLASLMATLSFGALARRAAAIADRHRRRNLPPPGQDERVRSVLRTARAAKRASAKASVASQRLAPSRRPAPPGYGRLRRMAARCPGDLCGLRDRALLLLTAAGFGGKRLLALDREHIHFTAHVVIFTSPSVDARSLKAVSPSVSEAESPTPLEPVAASLAPAGSAHQDFAFFAIGRLAVAASCPVHALERWLEHSDTRFGPVFRKVNRWGGIEHTRLRPDALRRIWQRRADALRPTPTQRPPCSRAEDTA